MSYSISCGTELQAIKCANFWLIIHLRLVLYLFKLFLQLCGICLCLGEVRSGLLERFFLVDHLLLQPGE